MPEALICDAIRTPIGRYGGALAPVRADDLAAIPIKALMARRPDLDWGALEEVALGCVNQAGEDNRNVARMALLLAGLSTDVAGVTVNRLCGSGMEAVGQIARAIRLGELDLALAGGVESMSRSPFVMGKAESPFSRSAELQDTTIGWRFANPAMKALHGLDSNPEATENLVAERGISRADQDEFALRSQQRASAAIQAGRFAAEITPVTYPRKGGDVSVDSDEHPRPSTTLDQLARLPAPFVADGTVTAGNASGVNDGAAAMIMASAEAASRHALAPRARIVAMASAGVPPRIFGIGPVPASRKALAKAGLDLSQMDIVEINEAFAGQVVACLRDLGLPDDAEHVNPNGGAIALGHPLGMSGARLVMTAVEELHRRGGRYALCTMCIGVGQGIAIVLERV